MPITAGDRVTVRGHRWLVEDSTSFPDCALVSLSGRNEDRQLRTCNLLVPFDRPVKQPLRKPIRAITGRRWMRVLHDQMSRQRRFGELRGAAAASIEIFPYQLEPAIALMAGRASRMLLADEVGLGKTIQAGLILAELQHRGWCERALIVTPSGLRHQWVDELKRFDVAAMLIDAEILAALTRSLPVGLNPWTTPPVIVTSIDFIKQPEVLQGVGNHIWDIVIVDEAHQATPSSLRYDAARALAARARHVVLLTATPHSGDDAAYRALCDIGKLHSDDPILLFRRTRQQVGLRRSRRVHLLRITLPPESAALHRMLGDYVRRLWQSSEDTGTREGQLVAAVLSKRAFSSACSLARSLERRLVAISDEAPVREPVQWSLSFEADLDGVDELPSLAGAALDDALEEAALLRALLELARRAGSVEPKVTALQRLLRRVQEPVIVFTEYRDTLEMLERALCGIRTVTTLHGGQTPEERLDAVRAFNAGEVDLLLATDAGAEGLNLQRRCRLVVNLELPWNPVRLEQRIGRVDRIGQTRPVHAINLVADGTAEGSVLAALLRRQERIYASEIEIAASIINGAAMPTKPPGAASYGCTDSVDLGPEGRSEAQRIALDRRLQGAMTQALDEAVVPVTMVRSRLRRRWNHGSIWFVRVRLASGTGRLIEDMLVPVHVEGAILERHHRRREIRSLCERLIEQHGARVTRFVAELAGRRARALGAESATGLARAVSREHHLVSHAAQVVVPLVQPGLFDNRAVARQQMAEDARRQLAADSAQHGELLDAGASAVLAQAPEIALMVVTC